MYRKATGPRRVSDETIEHVPDVFVLQFTEVNKGSNARSAHAAFDSIKSHRRMQRSEK